MLLHIVLSLLISLHLPVDGPRFGGRNLANRPTAPRRSSQDNVSRVLGGYLPRPGDLAPIVVLSIGLGIALLGLPYAVVFGARRTVHAALPSSGWCSSS